MEKNSLKRTLSLICAMLVASYVCAYLASTVAGGLYYILNELIPLTEYAEDIILRVLDMAVYTVQMLTPVALFLLAGGDVPSFENYEKKKLGVSRLIAFALCAFALSYVLSMTGSFFEIAFGFEGADLSYPSPEDPLTLLFDLVSMALLPALFEEFVFRKLIFGNLAVYGRDFAVLASALLFASVHTGAPQAMYSFGYGVIFAYLVYLTGSLRYPVIIHFLNNAYSVVMDYLSVKIPEDIYGDISLLINITLIFAGLIAGAYLVGKGVFAGAEKTENQEEKRSAFACLVSPLMLIYYAFIAIKAAVIYFK